MDISCITVAYKPEFGLLYFIFCNLKKNCKNENFITKGCESLHLKDLLTAGGIKHAKTSILASIFSYQDAINIYCAAIHSV